MNRNKNCEKCPITKRSFVKYPIDILPDRDRVSVQPAGTGHFTESRTDTSGEFRKTRRLQETVFRAFEMSVIQFVVPFRDEIVERATGDRRPFSEGHGRLTERDAAVHAAGRLFFPFLHLQRRMELMEILQPFERAFVYPYSV